MIRPYTEQFDKSQQRRIEALIVGYGALAYRDYRYQIYELQCCLHIGLLLAALHLASSLLEMFVRDLVVSLVVSDEFNQGPGSPAARWNEIERQLEEERGAGFSVLVKRLLTGNVILKEDAVTIKQFYSGVRVPLLHGLMYRFVALVHPTSWEFEEFLAHELGRFRAFEEAVFDSALDQLEFVLSFMVRQGT